jgi:transposase-like protein
MSTSPVSYKRHRFPHQIIAHAVWLYIRFPLSLRLVEELLLERGIAVFYETIRRWGKKFGPDYARRLRCNSHVPLRKRERIMQGFRSPGGLQRSVSVFSAVRKPLRPNPVHNAPHTKTAFTASRRSRSGKLRPEPWPEIDPQGRTSNVHPNSS